LGVANAEGGKKIKLLPQQQQQQHNYFLLQLLQ
jgi:hypothetical protein